MVVNHCSDYQVMMVVVVVMRCLKWEDGGISDHAGFPTERSEVGLVPRNSTLSVFSKF
jgi:hypothetical protein